MTDLRDRRRQKTADDIQQATLRLAARHGFDVVTTGMIAAEAGLSIRTFFNYYTNKEAAAVGVFRDFAEENVLVFANGTGTLSADLEALIQTHLEQLSDRKETIRALILLTAEAPALQLRHLEALRRLHERLVQILALRMRDAGCGVLDLIAEMAIAVVRQAIHAWTDDDRLTLRDATDIAFARLRQAVQLSIV